MATEQKPKTSRARKSTQGKSSNHTTDTNSNSKITTNHATIKKWAEDRGGNPSTVKSTSGNGAGILRIDFPGSASRSFAQDGYSGEESLEQISWEDFFDKFDDSGLAFLYQEQTSDGRESRFNKFVSREEQANTGEPEKSEMD